MTSEPGSALPLIASSSLFTSFAVGASGAVLSATVVVALSEVLPALSVAVTQVLRHLVGRRCQEFQQYIYHLRPQ